MLHACQAGFETFLVKELNTTASERGAGWVRGPEADASDACFPHYSLKEEVALTAATAKTSAQALVDYFLQTSRGENYDAPWPLMIEGGGEEGAVKRANTVEELFLELAKKRMSRVVKLAATGRPGPGARRGLFAYFTGLDRFVAAREGVFGGQRRMADDPQAPSRSYLKAEEAYAALGDGPKAGELVVDLGAAPGGWSYSAAKRGAKVVAVDNGPLKGGALAHPLIEHRAEDAFKYEPPKADWLFCDMIEDPERVLDLTRRWLEAGRCRRLVVNLKFGRHDPLPLIRKAKTLPVKGVKVRHLYHDREEVTILA